TTTLATTLARFMLQSLGYFIRLHKLIVRLFPNFLGDQIFAHAAYKFSKVLIHRRKLVYSIPIEKIPLLRLIHYVRQVRFIQVQFNYANAKRSREPQQFLMEVWLLANLGRH